MKYRKHEITLIVTSADANIDILNLWLKLFERFWSDPPAKKMFNLQTIKVEAEHNFVEVCSRDRPTINLWSKRLQDVLCKVDTEYSLVMLDDYFIRSNVNTNMLSRLIDDMDNNSEINCIYLRNLTNSIESEKFSYLNTVRKDSKYSCNTQVAIWRTKTLKNLLRPYENPWEFEIYGSKRARSLGGLFYCLARDIQLPINCNKLGALVRGQWLQEELHSCLQNLNMNDYQTSRPIYKINHEKNIILSIIKLAGFKFGISHLYRKLYHAITQTVP
jgi:hypothetical protein